jgi:hypothetical protein
MNSVTNKDLLSLILQEASLYNRIQDLEAMVETGGDLAGIPVQPLYLALKQSSKEQVALVLPKLSKSQRVALLDLDLWKKDDIDVQSFQYWVETYSLCPDLKIIAEFAKSEEFMLFVKSRVNIQTIDMEEPEYPNHDNFFVTDDDLLLFEFDEAFEHSKEVQFFIKNIYGELGVDNAYSFLFKVLVDSQSLWQEQEYQFKNERLRDLGFVDYYDALRFRAYYNSLPQLDGFIKAQKSATGEIDDESLAQNLHASVVISYKQGLDDMRDELGKLDDVKRQNYLRFNFIRMVNATITLEDGLKSGSIALNRTGRETRCFLELALDYIKLNHPEKSHAKYGVFYYFDFADLYKIGGSLIHIEKKRVKDKLLGFGFTEQAESFLGGFWTRFLDAFYDNIPEVLTFEDHKAQEINSFKSYNKLKSYASLLIDLLPYMIKFKQTLNNLIKTNAIYDQFYLNYKTDDIDFDAILISSFINFGLAQKNQTVASQKMGVSISELKQFISHYFTMSETGSVIQSFELVLKEDLLKFTHEYGFDKIEYFDSYLYYILKQNLEGYEFEQLSDEEFAHVGGPIIFNI